MGTGSGADNSGPASMYCANCGRPLTAGLTACSNCGAPVWVGGTPGHWGGATATYQGQGYTPPPPPLPSPAPGMMAPLAGYATVPSSPTNIPGWQPAPPAEAGSQRGRRGLIIGGVAAVVLIALLASGGGFVLGAFAAHTELDAAKYLPGNTVVFSAVDLVNLATNGFKVNLDSLRNSNGADDSSFERSTGLNWQSDVLPWLGRVVAAGAVLNTAAGASPALPTSPVGG